MKRMKRESSSSALFPAMFIYPGTYARLNGMWAASNFRESDNGTAEVNLNRLTTLRQL